MLSWYHPHVRLVHTVLDVSVPRFNVSLPCGEVNVDDVDRLANHRSFFPLAMPRGRGTDRILFVREGESQKPTLEHVADLTKLRRYKAPFKGIGYTLGVVARILWLIGLPWRETINSLAKMTAVGAHRVFSELCLNAARIALGIKCTEPHPLLRKIRKLPIPCMLILYRARRATAPARPSSPLSNLESFRTPIDSKKKKLFSKATYESVGNALLLSRKVTYESFVIRPQQSTKSTAFMPASMGGYNKVVGLLCDRSLGIDFVPLTNNNHTHSCDLCPRAEEVEYFQPFEGRPHAEELFTRAFHQRNERLRCFNNSLLMLSSLKRPLIAFSIQLNERARKDRTPNIPEGFAQTVASGISTFGFKTLELLFPVEFKKRGRPMMLKNTWYKSGDYQDSTSYIYWEAGRVAWDIILDHSRLGEHIKNVFKSVLKKLIGPHIFFCCGETRRKMRDFFYPRSKSHRVTGYRNLRKMKGANFSAGSVPVVNKQLYKGSTRGIQEPLLEYDKLDFSVSLKRLEALGLFVSGVETVESVRGILMSYRIAAPALMVLNAIPHWEMKSLRKSGAFFCSGDDNASSAKSRDAINSLEKRKEHSGMKVHTSVKAFESTRGFILTEDLYLESDSDYLEKVLNFPIRCLFPETTKAMDFITVPADMFTNLKEVCHFQLLSRMTSLLLNRYERLYKELRRNGVSVLGPDSIFKWMKWDGLPYTSNTVKGLYIDSRGTDGISVFDVSQFMTANKSFASDYVESSDPYLSRRCTEKDVSASLSSVPITSVYRVEGPFKRARSGTGVEVILENLKSFLDRGDRDSHFYRWAPPGAEFCYYEEEKPTKADLVGRLDKEIRKDHYVGPNGLSFHSDVQSLSRGIAPTSEPGDPIDFSSLARFKNVVVIDYKNILGGREEYPEWESKGELSTLTMDIIRRLTSRPWFRKMRAGVFHVVLEQPGVPRYISLSISKVLVISRPRGRFMGADGECCALIDLYNRKFGKQVILYSNDKKIRNFYDRLFN